jgi:endonuclease YncB( thermonuclease family)
MNITARTLALFCLGVAFLVTGAALAGHQTATGKCVKVIDGDTLIVECDTQRRTVNLDGIDAPELGQPWGKEVRSFVRDMVRGREVEIEVLESSGDAVRARVTVDGYDLSQMLVSRGLAWVSDDAADRELSELSAKAKSTPCGLWRDADPVPPWEFRQVSS